MAEKYRIVRSEDGLYAVAFISEVSGRLNVLASTVGKLPKVQKLCDELNGDERKRQEAASKVWTLLCCLLVCLAWGCSEAAEAPQELTTSRQVPALAISSALSLELQEAALQAAHEWQGAGIEFTATVGPGANLGAGSCQHLATHAAACAEPGEWVRLELANLEACQRWARVDGITRCYRVEPRVVILHELGHWLGVGYHLPEGNVLQPHFDAAGEYPRELTALDIEAVRAVQ